MSDSVASLRHKINSAEDLESVVRTMKAMAASSIGQYEHAVRSLDDYYRTVQLGLAACFGDNKTPATMNRMAKKKKAAIGVIVFGSDQGLVGQFNEVMVEYTMGTLEKMAGKKILWAVGERIQSRLEEEAGIQAVAGFPLPNSIDVVTLLVGQILIELEEQREQGLIDHVYLFHNRPNSGSIYIPTHQQLLPMDEIWAHNFTDIKWPTRNLPEVMNNREQTLRALVREYLFVTLFRACTESLASENASRLAAMQCAEKNIDELQEDLKRTFHRVRQRAIDEELFDVISGFESLT